MQNRIFVLSVFVGILFFILVPKTQASCLQLTTTLKIGSFGAEVVGLQDFLRAQGDFNSNSSGYFGSLTAAAVSLFQSTNGLDPVGYVGTLTRQKIQEISCSSTSQVGTASSVVADPLTPSLSVVNPDTGLLVTGPAKTVTGTYIKHHADDFVNEIKRETPAIEDSATGETYLLAFNGQTPNIETESTISATGVLSGSKLFVNSSASQTQTSSGYSLLAPPPASIKSGPPTSIRVATILINFKDKPNPYSQSEATQIMDQLSRDFSTNSYGKFVVSSNVFGPYSTLSSSNTGVCDYNRYAAEAISSFKLSNNGKNPLDLYDKVIFIFPGVSYGVCEWSGLANKVGGNKAWINGRQDVGTFEHELGHLLGLEHAHSLECANSQTSGCVSREYGDNFDFMGNSRRNFKTLNAHNRLNLGWLPVSAFSFVTQPGNYTIHSLDTQSTNPQVLKVDLSPNRPRDKSRYVEYRGTLGGSLIRSNRQNGTEVFYSAISKPIRIWEDDQMLFDGQTFYDESILAAITQISHTSTSATLSITPFPSSCVRRPPTLRISSNNIYFGYFILLVNNNTPQCGDTTYKLNAKLPVGASAEFFSPGSSFPVSTITLKSGGYAAELTVLVKDPARSVNQNNVTFSAIDALDQTQQPAVVDIKANNSDGPITLTPGQNLTLSWTSSNATFCSLGSPQNSGVPLSDSSLIIPSHPFYPKTSTTYSITCNGATGTVSDSVTVNAPLSASAPVVTLTASQTSIPSGQPVTLTWSSTNATSCSSKNWSQTNTSGTVTLYPALSTTYTVTCDGVGGTATKSVSVGVFVVDNFPPMIAMSVNTTSIQSGQSATITWNASSASSCSSPAWSSTSTSGSVVVSPTKTTTYSITCVNNSGGTSTTASVVISVIYVVSQPVPLLTPTLTVTASPISVKSGQPVTISWSSTNATSCLGPNDVKTSSGPFGSQVVYPNQTMTYTIYCYNGISVNGSIPPSANKSVTVNVVTAELAPVPSVSITANKYKNALTINSGDKVSLSWYSSNTTSCTLTDGFGMNSVVSTTGLFTVYPNQDPTTYTVTCTGSGGSASNSIVVTVHGGIAQANQLNQIASALAAIQALIIQMRGW